MLAETNSCIHVHVHDMSDRDDYAASIYVYVSVCLLRPRTAASREWVVRQGGVEAVGIDGYEGRRNRHLPGLDQKETFRECQGYRLAGRVTGGGL